MQSAIRLLEQENNMLHAKVRALEAEVERLRAELSAKHFAYIDKIIVERDQLKAEVERLRRQIGFENAAPRHSTIKRIRNELQHERENVARLEEVIRKWAYCSGKDADKSRVAMWETLDWLKKRSKGEL